MRTAEQIWNEWSLYERAKWGQTHGIKVCAYDQGNKVKDLMPTTWAWLKPLVEKNTEIDYHLPAIFPMGDEWHFWSHHEIYRAIETEKYPIVTIKGVTETIQGEMGTPTTTEISPIEAEGIADDYDDDPFFRLRYACMRTINGKLTICFVTRQRIITNNL